MRWWTPSAATTSWLRASGEAGSQITNVEPIPTADRTVTWPALGLRELAGDGEAEAVRVARSPPSRSRSYRPRQ